ncbi:MAG: replication initiator protein [Microviridae sp.]|nr:MAG: replication initiator protein [Microviridae sp.]
MPCYHPNPAWRTRSGELTLKPGQGVGFQLLLPCGNCIGCRMQRSRETAVRCMHEARMHNDNNAFITLTYDDQHLPADHSLHKEDFQKFMKRLRKWHGGKLLYLMCGEYGETKSRPHFHALLFGCDFPDKTPWRKSRGHTIWRSQVLEKLWTFGYSEIGSVTFQSAAYVARYVLKKQSGPRVYEYTDPATGEVHKLLPEFTTRSLKPGIGESWFRAYKSDVYPHDFCVVKGTKVRTPRFYDVLLERYHGEAELLRVKRDRIKKAYKYKDDQTPERLAVREKVQASQIKLLKRTLD